MQRLEAIERDLAERQNLYESAAQRWYDAKRWIEKQRAKALLSSDESTVAEKRAQADLAAFDVEDATSEAEYEALKAVIRVLETRATVLQSLLKAHGRVS